MDYFQKKVFLKIMLYPVTELSLHLIAHFQKEMCDGKFVHIYEKSMVSCNLLRKTYFRCRSGEPMNQDKPVGGLFVYLSEDIRHLSPVNDRYSDETDGNELRLEGKLLFSSDSSILAKVFVSYFFIQTE